MEREFLQLADYVHFSDDQVNVYSMHIADLIVRCAIEIEALSKELYGQLGGNMSPVDKNEVPRDLYFDTDCIGLLEDKWHLSKKQITITAPSFFFFNPEYKAIEPLHKAYKRGTSGSKWKQAYQAVKHNRKNALNRATILNLLHAMGALYILNLYYKDETIDIGRVYMSEKSFDSRAGSDIFSVACYNATGFHMSTHMDDSNISTQDDLDKAIYIIKYTETSYREMHKNYCLDHQTTVRRFKASSEIARFLTDHPEYPFKEKTINQICLDVGGSALLSKIICFDNARRDTSSREEAKLNKHMPIYPTLPPIST